MKENVCYRFMKQHDQGFFSKLSLSATRDLTTICNYPNIRYISSTVIHLTYRPCSIMNNSDNYTVNITKELCSPWECNLVATSYIILSIIYVAFYIPCAYFIVTDKKLIRQSYYRIVMHMGILDFLTLLLNGIYSSILIYARRDSTTDDQTFMINKILGGLMNSIAVTYILFAHLLSFNRFMALCLPKMSKTVFSLRNTHKILFVCFIYNLGWFVAYQMPTLNIVYSIESFSWYYDTNSISLFVRNLDFIVNICHVVCMILWYVCLSIVLKLKIIFPEFTGFFGAKINNSYIKYKQCAYVFNQLGQKAKQLEMSARNQPSFINLVKMIEIKSVLSEKD
uniref:Gustatory receptor n=1 Tax=Romanomermis culicivorax TaxID=13658 RepID=A0A915IK00_ROMCU